MVSERWIIVHQSSDFHWLVSIFSRAGTLLHKLTTGGRSPVFPILSSLRIAPTPNDSSVLCIHMAACSVVSSPVVLYLRDYRLSSPQLTTSPSHTEQLRYLLALENKQIPSQNASDIVLPQILHDQFHVHNDVAVIEQLNTRDIQLLRVSSSSSAASTPTQSLLQIVPLGAAISKSYLRQSSHKHHMLTEATSTDPHTHIASSQYFYINMRTLRVLPSRVVPVDKMGRVLSCITSHGVHLLAISNPNLSQSGQGTLAIEAIDMHTAQLLAQWCVNLPSPPRNYVDTRSQEEIDYYGSSSFSAPSYNVHLLQMYGNQLLIHGAWIDTCIDPPVSTYQAFLFHGLHTPPHRLIPITIVAPTQTPAVFFSLPSPPPPPPSSYTSFPIVTSPPEPAATTAIQKQEGCVMS